MPATIAQPGSIPAVHRPNMPVLSSDEYERAADPKAVADAAEMKLNAAFATKPALFSPVCDLATAKQVRVPVLTYMDQHADRGPQRRRTEAASLYQQFSTPPAYGLLAAWVLALRPDDVVLEPSAGVGGLACFAIAAKVKGMILNELEEGRSRRLYQWVSDLNGGASIFSLRDRFCIHNYDAEHIDKHLPPFYPALLPAGHPDAHDGPWRVTAVLMNPPFTRSDRTAGDDGKRRDLHAGARHIEAALNVLAPGGRLVAIAGRGMAFGMPAHGAWWGRVMNQYRVRANIGIDGDVYKTRGTSFGTRLLVIDKLPPNGHNLVTTPADESPGGNGGLSLEAAFDLLAGIAVDRPKVLPFGSDPWDPNYQPQPHSARTAPCNPTRPSSPAAATQASPASSPKPSPASAQQAAGNPVADLKSASPLFDVTPISPAKSEPKPDLLDAAVEAQREALNANAIFEPYQPLLPAAIQSLNPEPHPTLLVESAAMSAAERPAFDDDLVIPLPESVITGGMVSDAQIEAISLAWQAFRRDLPDGSRRGFFVGCGTGLGKGRQATGVILADFNDTARTARQFKKAIWFSKTPKLLQDARRDWADVGGDPADIFPITDWKVGHPIERQSGILFCSYASLRSGYKANPSGSRHSDNDDVGKVWDRPEDDRSRLGQILQWIGRDFDGVIAFDESHEMRSGVAMQGKRGKTKVSSQAEAGIDMQTAVPRAKVLYLSATGATNVHNLAYAKRLGLWGEQTAFANVHNFIEAIDSGGVAAMELVARDMKTMGLYIARSLSFAGVEYDRIDHVLTPEQRGMYDTCAQAWQVVLQNFDKALELTASKLDRNGQVTIDRDAKAKAYSSFWGAHQRFFNQLLTALSMPSVIADVEQQLGEGNACVLQLVNTLEASLDRSLAKLDSFDSDSLEDVDLTPRDQIMQLVEHCFPANQMEAYFEPASGTMKMRGVYDADGKSVKNPQAVAMREALLTRLGAVNVPDGPLEMLVNHFGPDAVAEITGRSRRVVRKDIDGKSQLMVESRRPTKCLQEAREFNEDKRRILVFSMAGGTGASYHADEKIKNQRRRIHYLVQPGWVADAAVQGFGRTHRSRQVCAPLYKLVSTDLKGQKRFVSTIARRLDQLGALTKGQRQAVGNEMFKASDNLESDIARDSLYAFYRKMVYDGGVTVPRNDGRSEVITVAAFQNETGLRLVDSEGQLLEQLPPVGKFLNRLLSLKCDRQNTVFDAYHQVFIERVEAAILDGTLDQGMETIVTDRCQIVNEEVVYTDPATGGVTRQIDVDATWAATRYTWDDLMDGKATVQRPIDFYATNDRSGRLYAFSVMGPRTDARNGIVIERMRRTDPGGSEPIDKQDALDPSRYHRVSVDEAHRLWDERYVETPAAYTRTLHLITGCVLPIWDRLRGDPKVKRMRTDDGRDLIGRLIPDGELESTRKAMGLGAGSGENVEAVARSICDWMETRRGDRPRYELANGLILRASMIDGVAYVELTQPDFALYEELGKMGFRVERIDWKNRVICPEAKAYEAVMKAGTRWPIVGRAA